jgi:hypothetical protein
MIKKTHLLAAAAVVFALSMSSCGSSFDEKACDKLVDKIADENLKDEDYFEMMDQLEACEDYIVDQIKAIDKIEGRTERCDKFKDLLDSDQFAYASKFGMFLERAKDSGELKSKIKERYKEIEKSTKEKGKEIGKIGEKLEKKCR